MFYFIFGAVVYIIYRHWWKYEYHQLTIKYQNLMNGCNYLEKQLDDSLRVSSAAQTNYDTLRRRCRCDSMGLELINVKWNRDRTIADLKAEITDWENTIRILKSVNERTMAHTKNEFEKWENATRILKSENIRIQDEHQAKIAQLAKEKLVLMDNLEKYKAIVKQISQDNVNLLGNRDDLNIRINQLKQDKANLTTEINEAFLTKVNKLIQTTPSPSIKKTINQFNQKHPEDIDPAKVRRLKRRRNRRRKAARKKQNQIDLNVVTRNQTGFLASGWWNRWDLKDVLSLDCEHVQLIKANGANRVKAATISICDSSMMEIYAAKIFHEPGSFKVDPITFAITGFVHDTFVDGRPLKEVKTEVANLFKGKLVIAFGILKDLNSLELKPKKFTHFDLTDYYRTPHPSKKGRDLGQIIGLKRLCEKFFQLEIQSGVHSASEDAKATMKLFLEDYVPRNDGNNDKEKTDFAQFKEMFLAK